MKMDIERLLRLTADYHNFCSDAHEAAEQNDDEEMSLEELDFVAAAAAAPVSDPTKQK